jgi:tRNA 2-thiouridine synthesizing protein A
VIRLGAVIRDLAPGSLVRLLATDPAARSDVEAFCRLRGHAFVEAVDTGEHTAYLVRRVG